MSYVTVFEPISQLLFINFPSLEHKIFLKDLKSTLPASVALRFRNLGNIKFSVSACRSHLKVG